MKKTLSLILAMAMIIGCISVSAAYPTEFVTTPTAEESSSTDFGNGGNDNTAYQFTHAVKPKNATAATDMDFVLLDKDDAGNYLIAINESYQGSKAFDTDTSNGWTYSVTDESNIGWWINTYLYNDNKSGGGLYYLGEDIYANLVEKEWKTEPSTTLNVAEQTFKAYMVIPSYTEYSHYRAKLNAAKIVSAGGMWLRTPSNFTSVVQNAILRLYRNADNTNMFTAQRAVDGANYLQFLFWVKSDFFKTTKVTGIGSEVAKQFVADFNKSDLEDIYTETELVAMGFEAEAVSEISNVQLSTNIAAPGGTTTVTYDVDQASDSNVVGYYTCDADGSNPVAIENLTGASVKIPSSAGGKYFCAGVMNGLGTVTYSAPIQIAAALETFSSTVKPVADWGMQTTNNADYMFSTSWTDFIMLEAAEDGSDFLVMAKGDQWTSRIVPAGSGVVKMDPEANSYLPTFLNSAFLTIASDTSANKYSSSGSDFLTLDVTGLPSNVSPYVNKDALWRTEASTTTGDEYVFKAAVTVPSMSELKKHSDKIGTNEFDSWKTRTAVNGANLDTNNNTPMYVVVKGDTPQISAWHAGSNTYTFVIFRLNREFFMNVKLGLAEGAVNTGKAVMGSEVKKMLVANFARSEIKQAGYSDEELENIGFVNNEPEITNVTAQGIHSVAQTLTASYTYTDPQNDAEDTSKTEYQWCYADTADGELTEINGATGKTYKVTADMLGKYIAVKVRVYNIEGVKSATVTSAVTGQIAEREDIVVTLDSISKTGVSFEIDNSLDATEMTILYCVYNKTTGVLEYLNLGTPEVKNGTDSYSVGVNGFTVTDDHIVKAMVWDSFATMRPYALAEL